MGDTRVMFKCATAVRLSAARAVHVRHRFPVSAHVRRRLEKLRHLASVRLTCMIRLVSSIFIKHCTLPPSFPLFLSISPSHSHSLSPSIPLSRVLCLTRFNKIAIQGTPQMAVDKEAIICLSRVYSYYFKCNFPLFYV